MDHAHAMAMHDCKQCQLPNEFSALGQLGYLRKSESMSGHVPVLFMCCEYHFLDGTITGVEIALIRLSGLSKKLSGQVDRPAEVIRRTSR